MVFQNQTVKIRMNKMYVYINILCITEYNKNNNYVMYTMDTCNFKHPTVICVRNSVKNRFKNNGNKNS